MLLHSTYGAGASRVCPECNWLTPLNRSNYMAGHRQGSLKPGEMVLSCPSWEDLRVGVLDNSWPVISNVSHFIYQNMFSLHFSIQCLLTDSGRQAAELDYEKCPCLHLSCIWAVCLSVTYQGVMGLKTSGSTGSSLIEVYIQQREGVNLDTSMELNLSQKSIVISA